MKNKLLLLLLLVSATSFSQVAGYMGKRFTVNYSISPLLNFASDIPTVSVINSLGLNYVVGRRKEIAFNTGYSKSEDAIGLGYSTFSFSLALKLYRRTRFAFAPLGPYIKWEGLLNANKLIYPAYQDQIYNPANGSYKSVSRGGGSISYRSIGMAFGFGRQRIFFDRLVVDLGLRFGFLLPLDGSADFTNPHQRDVYDEGQTTLSPFANVRLGLGFLAF